MGKSELNTIVAYNNNSSFFNTDVLKVVSYVLDHNNIFASTLQYNSLT